MRHNILIVDDEESIRKTLGGILEDEGYNVWLARDGKEAMELAREKLPHLVILDIWMPGMDGMEVLEKLKEQGRANIS